MRGQVPKTGRRSSSSGFCIRLILAGLTPPSPPLDNPFRVITGFNTDVKYRGVVYHVQTEDKGTSNPVIETLIYRGGEILGSRRLPYGHLARPGDEPAITKPTPVADSPKAARNSGMNSPRAKRARP